MKTNSKSLNVAAAAILGACAAAGAMGAKGGVLYAALMATGYSLAEYESIMAALVTNGFVERCGAHGYTLTDKGVVINAQIDRAIAEHQQRAAA